MTMSPAGTAPHSPAVVLPPRVLARAAALAWSRPMTSTALPPATASAPMAPAMFPVPMMLMLLMSCPVLTADRKVGCSDRRGAAADGQLHPVHVARVVRGEEQRDRRDLLGAAHLSPRDQGFELPHRRLVEHLPLLRRGDLARGQHVDPDPPVLQLGQPHAGPGLLHGL